MKTQGVATYLPLSEINYTSRLAQRALLKACFVGSNVR